MGQRAFSKPIRSIRRESGRIDVETLPLTTRWRRFFKPIRKVVFPSSSRTASQRDPAVPVATYSNCAPQIERW
jgi:hypothetical protein